MSNISNGESFQKILADAQALEQLNQYLLGLNIGLDPDLAEKIGFVMQQTSRHITLPDRFNDVFAQRGWIATEDLSTNLMEQALSIYEKQSMEKAEEYLCDQFDDEYFELHGRKMRAIWVWKEAGRERLFNLAYEDHGHERYHACIPVVLAQIDGLAYDTNKVSFFGKASALEIKDSVAGHESGLKALAKKTGKPKHKTRSHPIGFPYRNGILHGRELAYDNRIVSVKSFFALFALRPWALKCQQSEFNKQSGNEYEDIPGFIPGELLKVTIENLLES